MLQSILTASFDAVLFGSAAYFAIGFVLHIQSRLGRSIALPLAEEILIPDEELDALVPQPPALQHNIVAFVRPRAKKLEAIDWASLDPFQLRKECSLRGIRWRNAAKNGKHLRKSEMIAMLESWQLQQVS